MRTTPGDVPHVVWCLVSGGITGSPLRHDASAPGTLVMPLTSQSGGSAAYRVPGAATSPWGLARFLSGPTRLVLF